jgi:2'-5' RNA ligase
VTAPLVITLAVDPESQARFDAERARLFPAGRTEIGAHVTLFHAVPGGLEEQVRVDLVRAAGPAFPVGVAGVLPLGNGAAYALASPELARRHRELQELWWDHLTPQDRQGFRPHVTVQNKVTPAEARATVAVLRRAFRPHEVRAEGFVLWRYDGGPWTELARIPFAD